MTEPEKDLRVAVIIPALNEEESLPLVLESIPAVLVNTIIVVDNGSTDSTLEIARTFRKTSEADAASNTAVEIIAIQEHDRGYGAACLAGIDALPEDTDIVVFLDADHSDYPEEMPALVSPIAHDEADLVIGSRILGGRGRDVLVPQAFWGNKLAVFLIRCFWGFRYTDLGPFRAIRRQALERLAMRDRNFGWTVEMQVRALERGLRVEERPVRYRKRLGTSKISGTISGTIKAGSKILYTIFRLGLRRMCRRHGTS